MMYSENICKSLCPPVFEFHFLKLSRLDVAKQNSYTFPSNPVHGPEIWKSWQFPKYWRWWGVQASKFMKFARCRDFNALRRATLHKWCILKTFEDRCVRRCLNFTSWKYHGWALRIKKVTRDQTTCSMYRKFGNHEIFENVDAGEGFRPLNSGNSLAGAISMPCGAPRFILHDS